MKDEGVEEKDVGWDKEYLILHPSSFILHPFLRHFYCQEGEIHLYLPTG
jgi:hypothetical protein